MKYECRTVARPKLALVEPIFSSGLDDRPNLGCAYLIAACEEKGVEVSLIHGQTYYLHQMMIENADETRELFQGLSTGEVEEIKGLRDVCIHLRSLSRDSFKKELKELYVRIFIEKSPAVYFHQGIINRMFAIHNWTVRAYLQEIKKGREDFVLVDKYVEMILSSSPDMVGFSLYLPRLGRFPRLIRKKLKQLRPHIPIILGGSYTPFLEKDGMKQFFEKEFIDYLVVGEGEVALPKLINALHSGSPSGMGENIFYRKGEKIASGRPHSLIEVNTLPFPAFSQFHLDRYLAPYRILPIQSARGCSYRKCSFCSHYSIGMDKYRGFTPERVVEMIDSLRKEYGCNHFVFHDDELPPGRLKLLSLAIMEKKIDTVFFYGYGRLIHNFLDDALLDTMKMAGFRAMAWGLESGSQKVIDLMRKGTDVSLSGEILKKFHEKGMLNLCFFFFGFPGETEADASETVKLLKRNADYIHLLIYGVFVVNKSAPVWRERDKFGLAGDGKGRYTVETGMNKQAVRQFNAQFDFAVRTGMIRVMNRLAGYQYPVENHARMQTFLMGCHELLPSSQSLAYLKTGNRAGIYPLIPREKKCKEGDDSFTPIDITKSSFRNEQYPLKPVKLTGGQIRMTELSDGTRNVEAIKNIVAGEFQWTESEAIHETTDFFTWLYSNDYAYSFGKRWRNYVRLG